MIYFFSIHPIASYEADILMVAPIAKNFTDVESLLNTLRGKYKISTHPDKENTLYHLDFNNKSVFNFYVYKGLVVGSFNQNLVKKSLRQIIDKQNNKNFNVDFNSVRNKNSIANLYINFSKLRDFANNFTNRKNPYETYSLKSFDASASLNINYQKCIYV